MSSRGPRFRRNGKLFACEPCRKQKVACDHGLPVCGRCRKKNADTDCVYHPAPLSKSGPGTSIPSPSNWRNASLVGAASITAINQTSKIRAGIFLQARVVFYQREQDMRRLWKHFNTDERGTRSPISPPNSISIGPSVSSLPQGDAPGFLGSISFSEVFKASGHSSDNIWLGPLANVKRSLSTPSYYTLSQERIENGAKILSLLSDSAYVLRIIKQFYSVSQIVVAPWVTIKNAIESIEKTLRDECGTEAQRIILAEKIFAQTFVPLVLEDNTSAENFHESFTGPKLRWEIFGLIFTYLALGSLMDPSEPQITNHERQLFTRELTQASNLIVTFCTRAESLNDILVWFLHGNGILLTFQYGDTSHLAWRRVGDLASTIFAIGLHQDPGNQPKLPFFLAELRRRSFANSYSSDKALSTFFGRPPRISMRYCSCQLPYDLTEEELIAPVEIRDRAIARLDSQGWNTDGKLGRQTWARIKLLINTIREDVLELSLAPAGSYEDPKQKAQDTLDRGEATWKSIPDFARYDESCWTSGLPANHCFTLLYYYLHITYSEFLLYRILARHGGSTWDAVYQIAMRLLTAVLNISKHRDRVSGLSRDFSWVSIFYGLPSASLLAIELLRQQQQRSTNISLPRSEIIRNISVFISSLDWVAKEDDGNYLLCQGARQMLEKILDAILDARPEEAAPNTQIAPADPVLWVDELFGGGWMASGPFVDSVSGQADTTSVWEMTGNWPFEF